MNTNCFTFKVRTQFSFIVDARTLSCILSGIAKQKINVTGLFQTKLIELDDNYRNKSNSNIVRLVVGSADCENSKELLGVRCVLHSIGVNFEEKSIIQMVEITPETPGLFSYINNSLLYKVIINALYIGEETTYFIDVSDLYKALKLLSETTIEECPQH